MGNESVIAAMFTYLAYATVLQKMENVEVLKKNITNNRIKETIKQFLSIWNMAVNFKRKRKAEIYSVCCDNVHIE